jgi:clan AA aspartic protease
VDALVDTGATRSAIPAEVVERLGLIPIEQVTGKLATGERTTVGLCGPIDFQIMGRATYDDAYIMGDEVLIGQVVLEKTDLLVDCAKQTVVPRHPEGQINRL